MSKWIIIGATSAIATATARLLAARGHELAIAARDMNKLDIIAQDLRARGAPRVERLAFDALDGVSVSTVFSRATELLGGADGLLVAHGTLPVQTACEHDFQLALEEIRINALSVLEICSHAANYFEARSSGSIAVISSVAGDRGRKSNYIYGSAKGMVSIFLQGLRNRLSAKGVHVLTIKPGFVDTPMTAAFDKSGPLWATADQLAAGIVSAIEKRADVVYLPKFWSLIMLVIKHIPEMIFKRMSL